MASQSQNDSEDQGNTTARRTSYTAPRLTPHQPRSSLVSISNQTIGNAQTSDNSLRYQIQGPPIDSLPSYIKPTNPYAAVSNPTYYNKEHSYSYNVTDAWTPQPSDEPSTSPSVTHPSSFLANKGTKVPYSSTASSSSYRAVESSGSSPIAGLHPLTTQQHLTRRR